MKKEMSISAEKLEILELVSKNINFYRYHCNNTNIMNEKGIATVEKLAEESGTSPNMVYNLTAKNVRQGVSLELLDKIARALDISIYCLFLKEPNFNPEKYGEK